MQVAALVPKTELDGEMGDAHVALQARLMSQALRKLSHSLSLSQTILLFINQVLIIHNILGVSWSNLFIIYSIMYLIEAKLHISQKIVAIFFTLKFWNYMLLKQKGMPL
jgi:hypothetical protein